MIKLLLALFIICTLAKAESVPDYEELARPTESNETSGQAKSLYANITILENLPQLQ